MTDYLLRLSCPTCPDGTEMDHVAGGVPGLAQTQAVCACGVCGTRFRIEVRLINIWSEAFLEGQMVNGPNKRPAAAMA